ncbi:hypothetical protein ACUR5C_07255 [Aliikangiella sp. IMCC44653]
MRQQKLKILALLQNNRLCYFWLRQLICFTGLVMLACNSFARESSQLYQQPSQANDLMSLNQAERAILPVFYQGSQPELLTLVKSIEPQLKLKLTGHQVKLINIKELTKKEIESLFNGVNDCAVTIGPIATQKIASIRNKTPLFSLLVSKTQLDQLHHVYARLGVPISGIYHEQPPLRQLLLAKTITPDLNKVALFFDQADKYQLANLKNIASQLNLDLAFQILFSSDPPEKFLSKIVADEGVLLISNNRDIYTESKLAAVVLSAYYRNIKLIGNIFEHSEIGALASIYTATTALSIEASNQISEECQLNQFSPPRYANSFSVVINHKIAESLRLKNNNENEISRQIATAELRELSHE